MSGFIPIDDQFGGADCGTLGIPDAIDGNTHLTKIYKKGICFNWKGEKHFYKKPASSKLGLW